MIQQRVLECLIFVIATFVLTDEVVNLMTTNVMCNKPLLVFSLQDFAIVEADESQVFIAASHRGGSVTLYLSDATGQFYVKSLDHVVAFHSGHNFLVDLYEVIIIIIVIIVMHSKSNTHSLAISYNFVEHIFPKALFSHVLCISRAIHTTLCCLLLFVSLSLCRPTVLKLLQEIQYFESHVFF